MLFKETILDIWARGRSGRMFRNMVEAAPCGMVMVDASGRMALVNPRLEQMFGYAREELVGNAVEMLLPERFRAIHGSHREAYCASPAIRPLGAGRDLAGRRKDGTEFAIEIGLSPVPGEGGGLVLAAVTDITRHKTVELRLRQANALMQDFAYAAAHDLRSPLQGISALAEWIVADLGGLGPPEVARNLERMRDRIGRLERVVDDVLAYARAGTTSTEVTPVEPRALIEEVLEIQPLPAGFQVSVCIEAEPFVTTRAPLESTLRNLVGNAVKHHDLEVGTVRIHVEDVDEYCLFTISDDGPGIPAVAQERVFRMFQTLSPATGGGTGIGLALSKRLVESHGGRIDLQSTDGERGTSFRVWWPRFQSRKSHG